MEAQGKREKRRLYVDMDGTLTEFLPQSSMAPLYVKGYFQNLPPHREVIEAVRMLHRKNEIEVFILSAYLVDSEYALAEKNAWVDRYLPEIDAAHRLFVPNGSDKRACIGDIRPDDALLDDYTKNLLRWQPSRAIKLINAINNTKGTWTGPLVRYDRAASELVSDILQAMQVEMHRTELL